MVKTEPDISKNKKLLRGINGGVKNWDDTIFTQPSVANQLTTPIDIAKFMARIGELFPHKTVIDPACGIGTILIQCAKLYPDAKLFGLDINKVIINECKKILEIIGLKKRIELKTADTLHHHFNEKYDLVISHFPFGGSPGRGMVYGFIGKSLSILKKNGTLICIVPAKILGSSRYLELRRKIINEYSLEMVMTLSSDAIKNIFVDTAVLVIRGTLTRNKVLLTTYKEDEEEIIRHLQSGSGGQRGSSRKMLDRWNLEYHDPEYKSIEKELKKHDTRPLSEFGVVIRGIQIPKDKVQSRGKYLILSGRHISVDGFIETKKDLYTDRIDSKKFKECTAQIGDIIVSSIFKQRKILHYDNTMPKAVVSNNCFIIRSPNNDYLQTYLKSERGIKLFIKQSNRGLSGGVIPHLNLGEMEKIRIPIIPLENLNDIGNKTLKTLSDDEVRQLIKDIEELKKENVGLKEEIEIFQNKLIRQDKNNILNKIAHGETINVEFKSSLRTPLETDFSNIPKDQWEEAKRSLQKGIEKSVLKTICAFCNSGGGELFIGVNDEGKITGIEVDGFENEDKFQLHLKELVVNRIKPTVINCVKWEIIKNEEGKSFCRVICNESHKEIWQVDKNSEEEFYVRFGPSSIRLKPRDAVKYIKDHFKEK